MTKVLEGVAASYALPGTYLRCVAFMLDGLKLVEDRLPQMARDALTIAVRYWIDGDRGLSLGDQKAGLWAHLDGAPRTGTLDDAADAALRAVLCVLEPRPMTADVFELLDWFVQFVTPLGARHEDLTRLLKEHFP